MLTQTCSGKIRYSHTYTLDSWVCGAAVGQGGIYNEGDALTSHEGSIERDIGSAQEKARGDLGQRHEAGEDKISCLLLTTLSPNASTCTLNSASVEIKGVVCNFARDTPIAIKTSINLPNPTPSVKTINASRMPLKEK